MIFGLDRHYYPVDLPDGATVRINGTPVSLTPGVYYAHDSSYFPSGFPSFYAHLRARLASVLGGTWKVEPWRPQGYSLTSGVRLSVTGISATTLELASTTPLVRQLLGFGPVDTATVSFVGGRIESPYAAYGSWCPWSAFDGRAASKDSHQSRQMASSSDAAEDAVSVIWRDRRMRLIRYPLVYGATVYGRRSGVQVLADQAGVALWDSNNSLLALWEAVGHDATGLGSPRQVLIHHDATDLSFEIQPETSDIGLLPVNVLRDLEDVASRNGMASDLWDVSLPYVITGGFYAL